MALDLREDIIRARLPVTERVELADSGVPGLRLRLMGTTGVWSLMIKIHGKMKRAGVGEWPHLSVTQAREAAWALRHRMKYEGHDPVAERRETNRQALEKKTLEQWRQLWLAYVKGSKKFKQNEEANSRLGTAEMGARDVEDLTAERIVALVDLNRDAPYVAWHRYQTVYRFCNWLVRRKVLQVNPCFYIEPGDKPKKPEPRDRVLTAGEVQKIWQASLQLSEPYRSLVQLLMCLPLRRGEAAQLTADMVHEDGIHLPPEITKTSVGFVMPLNSQARKLMETLPSEGYLFPSSRHDDHFKSFGRGKASLDGLSGVENFHLHDFRTLVTTRLAEGGVRAEVADALLNHASSETKGPIRKVYDHAELRQPKQQAIEAWGRELAHAIEAGEWPKADGDKVIPLRA